MVTSIQLPIYASPTTEDDGEFIPDDATEEEKEDIEDEGQQAWEDAGRPGDTNDDDDNDDDDSKDNNDDQQQQQEEQITCPDGAVVNIRDYCPDVTTCPDGSTIAVGQECPAGSSSNDIGTTSWTREFTRIKTMFRWNNGYIMSRSNRERSTKMCV